MVIHENLPTKSLNSILKNFVPQKFLQYILRIYVQHPLYNYAIKLIHTTCAFTYTIIPSVAPCITVVDVGEV